MRAEVASTPERRANGLMGRETVPDGTGMLFVFPDSDERLLWMKDTPVHLDVVFFDDEYRVAGIKQLAALDESLTDSEVATALVLEVRQGWFAEHGVRAGSVAHIVFGPGLDVR